MKRVFETVMKAWVNFGVGALVFTAIFVAETSSQYSVIWFIEQPRIPESLLKKD